MEAYDITPTRRCGLCHVATIFSEPAIRSYSTIPYDQPHEVRVARHETEKTKPDRASAGFSWEPLDKPSPGPGKERGDQQRATR